MKEALAEDYNAGTDECDSAGASSCSTATSLGHAASQGGRARKHLVQEALRVLRRESQLRTADVAQRDGDTLDSVNLWRGLRDTLGLLELAVREEEEDEDGEVDGVIPTDARSAVSVGLRRGGVNFLPQDEHVQEVCVYYPASSSQPARSGKGSGKWLPQRSGDAADAPKSPNARLTPGMMTQTYTPQRQDVPPANLLAREGSTGLTRRTASPSMAGLAGVKVISGGSTNEALSRTPPLTSLPPAMQMTPAKGSRTGHRGSGGSAGSQTPPHLQVQFSQWPAPKGTPRSSAKSASTLAAESRHSAPQKRRVTIRLADPKLADPGAGREADGGPWAGDGPIEDDGDSQIRAQVSCTPTGCACRSSRSLDESDDEVLKERLPPRLSRGPRPSPSSGRRERSTSQANLSDLSPDWAAWALAVHEVSTATAAAEAASGNPSLSHQHTILRPL